MNAERLHAIVTALKAEITEGQTPSLVRQLASALQSSAQDPSQQQAASTYRQQLVEVLRKAPSNQFSPVWRQALDELGVTELLGNTLLERVESILSRNEITPSAAAAELMPSADRLDALNQALDAVQSGYGFFNLGSEELDPGEFEVGFLIPRPAVDDALEELGQEFVRLKRILGPFLELATGTREDVRVRSIASSDFQVLLDSAPAVALLIATAVERLISSYEKVMNIRLAYQQLRENGTSEEALAPVLSEAEGRMAHDIRDLVEELLAERAAEDEARANELRKELTDSLNALANRIDKGYSIEVRAGAIPAPDEEEEADEETATRRHQAEAVLAMQEKLRFTNLSGRPILALPEGTAEMPTDGGAPAGRERT